MELINKDAIIAEIKRRIEAHKETLKNCDSSISEMVLKGSMSAYQNLLHLLDTLEVKDVDEVKIGETQIYLEDDGGEQPYDGKQWLDLSCTEYEIPKALFKDGDNVEILIRKAQKGE